MVQNEDVIIREYNDLPRIKKRDLDGYVKFEILQDIPINLDDFIIKYKVLSLGKNKMDLQVILFPKEIEKICSDIAKSLNIKQKYLNMNFDIVQKLIDREKINLKSNNCIVLENLDDVIILNSVRNKKVYTSSVLSKEKNTDYIISLLDKEKPLFYYGKEDEFITQIKENGFKVDKLNTRLNINYLCPNKIVDTFDNKHLVNIGVVIWYE